MSDLSRPTPEVGVTPTSFDRLFEEEYARVAAIARRVLGDPAAAEDVAQEVFLDLHRRFGDNPGAKAPAWARTAAAHTALNMVRNNRRRAVREERFAPDSQPRERPAGLGGGGRDHPGGPGGARPDPETPGNGPGAEVQRLELCRDRVVARDRGERGGNETCGAQRRAFARRLAMHPSDGTLRRSLDEPVAVDAGAPGAHLHAAPAAPGAFSA